jgi:hypothetical protein
MKRFCLVLKILYFFFEAISSLSSPNTEHTSNNVLAEEKAPRTILQINNMLTLLCNFKEKDRFNIHFLYWLNGNKLNAVSAQFMNLRTTFSK